MEELFRLLKGGDLRSIGRSNEVVRQIKNQNDFDNLFQYLFHEDRIVAMRAADVIEKVTLANGRYLNKHKIKFIELCKNNPNKEVRWHLALLVPRLILSNNELAEIWELLSLWALDKKESRIVRVNSIQGLFNILQKNKQFLEDFNLITANLGKENIPSINARLRKLNNASR